MGFYLEIVVVGRTDSCHQLLEALFTALCPALDHQART
jgi:hypothetical protein